LFFGKDLNLLIVSFVVMKVKEIMIESTPPFLDFLEKFRKEGLYGEKISNEIMVRDWSPDDPVEKHLIYVAGNKVAVVPIPIEPTKDSISSYYLVEDVPFDKDDKIDYRSAYQQVMLKAGYGRVGKGIIVPKGEKNPLIALHSGLAFHEGIFKDSP